MFTVELRMEDDSVNKEISRIDFQMHFLVGDQVTFQAENDGTLDHDLQIVGPDGIAIDEADAVAPGDALAVTVDLDEPGIYQLNCLVDNHLTEHNMQALIQVNEA